MENLNGLLRFDDNNVFIISRDISVENTPLNMRLMREDGSVMIIHIEFFDTGAPAETDIIIGTEDDYTEYVGEMTAQS